MRSITSDMVLRLHAGVEISNGLDLLNIIMVRLQKRNLIPTPKGEAGKPGSRGMKVSGRCSTKKLKVGGCSKYKLFKGVFH